MTKMVTDISNVSWHAAADFRPHELNHVVKKHLDPTNDAASGWTAPNLNCNLHELCRCLPPSAASQLLTYVEVYMDDFCAL